MPIGFAAAAIFIFFANPNLRSLIVGGAVAIVGLLIRAWASGHIRKNAELAVGGPYAYTRNPLYVGSFLLGVGFTVAAWNLWLVLLFAALFLGIYLPVMRTEAVDVARLFPADYEKYAANVPLFAPRLFAWRNQNEAARNNFDLALYLKYREYRAALGLAAAWSILLAKAALTNHLF